MTFNPPALSQKTAVPLLVVCLFSFGSSAYHAAITKRLATETVEAYAPTLERQAVVLIVEALPKSEKGNQAAHLAHAMATNVESRYTALSRAVENHASALAYQTFGWAVASILALIAVVESRRTVSRAA